MTDRIPGAPGRCKAVVAGQELQKMQAGEEFAITLRRDDQPIKEGTPYSKATVLPDELAARLCPGVEDPSPKDAFAALHTQKADTVRRSAGEKIILHNAAHTPLKGLKLYGKTTQNGTPTPDAPVALESVGESGSMTVKVMGKNLFTTENATLNSYILADGEIGSYSGFGVTDYIAVMPNTQYSYQYWYTANADFDACYDEDKKFICTTKDLVGHGHSGKHISFITPANCRYVRLSFKMNNYEFQFELGETATAYEPYKEPQTLTLPTHNGLNGIPVSSGGNYTDENGQQWICDEIDFAKGVYVQRIGTKVFNGTEKWTLAFTGFFYTVLHDMSKVITNPVFCDKYLGTNIYYNRLPDKSMGPWHDMDNEFPGENWLYIHDSAHTSANSLKNALAANPITVLYVLAQPFETPLSAEELDAYINAKLHTYAPTTTLTNDANADMELTYYTSSTAVQMIHSPADKGKILSIDEHGCVVLTPNEIGSVKDAFRVEPHYTTFYGGGGFYAVDTERQFELEFNDWTQNRHLRGKTLHVKTYAYDNAFYGIRLDSNDTEWLLRETPNPNADITKDPKSGVCEFDITIPKDIPADEVLIVSVPYAENPYTELEIYEKKDTVWDELKRLGVNHIIAYDFYDWNDEEYGYWRKWSDGVVELWMRFYGYVMEDDQNDGAAVFQLTLPAPLELDTDKRFHITMDAWGYSEEERGNKAPATYMWAEPAYEENGVTSELLVHVLSQNHAWTTVEGTAYIAGYWYNEEEGQS